MPAALALLVLSLVACGRTSAQTVEADPGLAREMRNAVDHASENGLADDQVALLKRSIAEGKVTFDIYDEAYRNLYACLREGSLKPKDRGVETKHGVPSRTIEIWPSETLSESASDQVIELCDKQHFSSIGSFYDTQPTTMDAWAKEVAPYRPAILACLRDNGEVIEDRASLTDLLNAVMSEIDASHVNCAKNAGYAFP